MQKEGFFRFEIWGFQNVSLKYVNSYLDGKRKSEEEDLQRPMALKTRVLLCLQAITFRKLYDVKLANDHSRSNRILILYFQLIFKSVKVSSMALVVRKYTAVHCTGALAKLNADSAGQQQLLGQELLAQKVNRFYLTPWINLSQISISLCNLSSNIVLEIAIRNWWLFLMIHIVDNK